MNKNIVINEKIIKKTKCLFNFVCLSDPDKILCKVESNVGNSVLFVKPTNGSICNYKTNFGEGHICKCPVRKEIYEKYNL
jgi:hypothetical protein